MSTADSRLHICAVMISYDIVPILLPLRLRKKISCTDHYRIAYIAILVIAVLGICLSLTSSSLSIIRTISNWTSRFYIPIVAAPFILAILGLRTSSHIALIGMTTGALAVFAWHKWIGPILLTDTSIFPCVLVNGITMLALDYFWKRSKRTKKMVSVTHVLPD